MHDSWMTISCREFCDRYVFCDGLLDAEEPKKVATVLLTKTWTSLGKGLQENRTESGGGRPSNTRRGRIRCAGRYQFSRARGGMQRGDRLLMAGFHLRRRRYNRYAAPVWPRLPRPRRRKNRTGTMYNGRAAVVQ